MKKLYPDPKLFSHLLIVRTKSDRSSSYFEDNKKKCNNSICKSRTPVNQQNHSKKRDSDLNTNRKIYERELSENLSNKVGCFNNKHKRKNQRIITNSFTANNNFNDKIILKKSNLEKIKSNLFQNNIKINDYLSTNPINHYESNRNLLSERSNAVFK